MFQTLVVSLVLTRLDYGNWLPVAGLPVYLVRRLQSVLNAAARLIYHTRRSDHISDALACFHWLRVPGRIEFKIAVLTYKCPPRSCAGVPRPFYTCRRPTQSTIVDAAFCRHQSLGSAYQQTVGSRAFPVAGPQTGNDLPEDVTSAELLAEFSSPHQDTCSGSLFLTTCWTSTDSLRWT